MTTTKQAKRIEALESKRAQSASAVDNGNELLGKLCGQANKLIEAKSDLSHDPTQSPAHNVSAAIARKDFKFAKELLDQAVQSMKARTQK